MTGEELPRARVRRRVSWLHAMWIIPLIAAAIAGWLIYERMRAYGPQVTIQFRDGQGLQVGRTPIKYRGVQVGEVNGVEVTDDRQNVLVKARLLRSAAPLATDGAVFWIVRPQVGWGNITGLNTVITGPEIQVLEGKGTERRTHFVGAEQAPVAMGAPGLKIILKAERPKSLRPDSPVYYRGVQVGVVQSVELASNATAADIHLLVWQRYAGLVRTGSAFWNSSGAEVKGGVFKGIEVEIDSLRALVAGGIEFASPEKSPPARAGTVFFLHKDARPEWLSWNPKIPIPKDRQP